MRGFSKPPLFLSAGLFILGVLTVLSGPTSPSIITLGMFFIGIAMVNLALSIPVSEKRPVRIEKIEHAKPARPRRPKKKARKRKK